jgi:GNAT superfamily N-acetyltransferase
VIYREAWISDIPQIQVVRHSVHENRLSDPRLVTDEDCKIFLSVRGRGWVCEEKGMIVGFAIADLRENNIWALFVRPEFEKKGVGRKLHDIMLNWYFSTSKELVWLGTAPGTRAESFYRKAGWTETGIHGKNEIKFEMKRRDWQLRQETTNVRSS